MAERPTCRYVSDQNRCITSAGSKGRKTLPSLSRQTAARGWPSLSAICSAGCQP
jgi:hypothetical protein